MHHEHVNMQATHAVHRGKQTEECVRASGGQLKTPYCYTQQFNKSPLQEPERGMEAQDINTPP